MLIPLHSVHRKNQLTTRNKCVKNDFDKQINRHFGVASKRLYIFHYDYVQVDNTYCKHIMKQRDVRKDLNLASITLYTLLYGNVARNPYDL